ncbi:division/cell wall cluster transcriptional repressor MraZ [Heliobacterium gestii]|uniref:Transcriptional regulator MraZ n=1 Tax=Heliomicrobium gestii TaxID=2699 RepID=A0A845LEF3_HELGE|nr:division/cell wall cluster transcriptional repressor MraZ [Heliomicrobium gestii]MBM7867511.1 MraZ protein [Heliomicrobium gestii]MZP43941.1 division/cell wall cluster transcriptional repressor MraZ [Heliomicrobium gestii]
MFMGEYQHAIDPKGRLFVPARLRESLGEAFVATKGLDGCLFVYPKDEWKQLEEKLKALPFTRSDARAFQRFFFSGAGECEVDKQGRILVPAHLREHAGLEKDVVIIGAGARVEIWSQERWKAYNEQAAPSYEEVAEKLIDFDL